MDVRSKSIFLIRAFLMSALLSSPAWALEEFSLFESQRSLTMGGAHLGIADDDLAVFANPAGIARIRHPRISAVDLQMEVSTGIVGAATTFMTGLLNSDFSFDEISGAVNKYHYYSFSFLPHFVAHNFSVNFIFRQKNAIFQKSGEELLFRRQNDTGIVAGFAIPLFGGVVKLGASGKMIHRGEVYSNTTNGTTYSTLDYGSLYQEGLGFGADAGAILTIPVRYFPAFSFRARNLGGMKFTVPLALWSSASDGNQRPFDEFGKYDAGYAMSFRFGPDSYVNLAVDMRDIFNLTDTAGRVGWFDGVLWHAHTGIEVMFNRTFYIRAGARGEYPSFGIGLWTRMFTMEVGAYGMEVGTPESPRASFRYMARLEIGY